jgi:hypothetical protein
MVQSSKLTLSRKEWRQKAANRADLLREGRKTIKRHKQKILELKHTIKNLETVIEKKSTK